MFSDLTFFVLLFLYILFTFYSTPTNLFSMLIISELFWISLYSIALLIAIVLNSVQILALSLFFLMFSAVEISSGFSILTLSKDKLNILNLGSGAKQLQVNSFFNAKLTKTS